MRLKAVSTALVLCAASSSFALARTLETELPAARTVCWDRVYGAAHLAAHPKQQVTRIMLLHFAEKPGETEPGTFYLNLMMNVRKSGSATPGFDYRLSAVCKPQGAALACENEWGGGRWMVSRAADGALVVTNGGLIANPNAFDAEEISDKAIKLAAKPDDGAWKLLRAPAALCRID